MNDLLGLLASLASIAIVVAIGWGVLFAAGRRPRTTFVVLLLCCTAGGICVAWAGGIGYAFRFDLHKIEFASPLAAQLFLVGRALLTLAVPALLLVPIGAAENEGRVGPVGGQWAAVLFGWFLACSVWSAVLFSWLTGYVK